MNGQMNTWSRCEAVSEGVVSAFGRRSFDERCGWGHAQGSRGGRSSELASGLVVFGRVGIAEVPDGAGGEVGNGERVRAQHAKVGMHEG